MRLMQLLYSGVFIATIAFLVHSEGLHKSLASVRSPVCFQRCCAVVGVDCLEVVWLLLASSATLNPKPLQFGRWRFRVKGLN